MNREELSVSYGDGQYEIRISSVITADGISLTITGGERPHVGGIVLSVPRQSLAGQGMSCDTWVVPVPGHKDTEVAVPIAEMVCRETGRAVSVTAGIHIEGAAERDIRRLVDNCLQAARLLIRQVNNAPE